MPRSLHGLTLSWQTSILVDRQTVILKHDLGHVGGVIHPNDGAYEQLRSPRLCAYNASGHWPCQGHDLERGSKTRDPVIARHNLHGGMVFPGIRVYNMINLGLVFPRPVHREVVSFDTQIFPSGVAVVVVLLHHVRTAVQHSA